MFDLPLHEDDWPTFRADQMETLPVAAYARKAPSSKRARDDPAPTDRHPMGSVGAGADRPAARCRGRRANHASADAGGVPIDAGSRHAVPECPGSQPR